MGPRKSARRISAGLAPTRRVVPRKPRSSPATTRQFKSPEPPGTIASKNAIHSATATTKMLAIPDAMYCTAHTTTALPPPTSTTTTSARHRAPRCQGDGGAGVHPGLSRGAAQVTQQILQALEIGRRHLEDVTVFARHMMTFEDARVLLHLTHPRLVAHVVGVSVAHRDE